jgi:transcriptional regulator with XRE-family HTH domain
MAFKRKQKQPTDRTVKPYGKIIRQLRRALKMTVEDLAEKAGCSKKTIENAEACHNIYWFTLGSIAQALNCKIEKIAPREKVAPSEDPYWAQVIIQVDVPLKDFDQTDELRTFISSLEKLIATRPGTIKPIDAWEEDKKP